MSSQAINSRTLRKIAAHQIAVSDLNTFAITFPDSMRMKSVMAPTRCWFNTSKSGDELISMKETFGLCDGRAEQHYYIPERHDPRAFWLVSSALESVEGRVWTAHTTITSRGCQHFPSLSPLWLVGDSDVVSLRCVWTRDRMMSFENVSG